MKRHFKVAPVFFWHESNKRNIIKCLSYFCSQAAHRYDIISRKIESKQHNSSPTFLFKSSFGSSAEKKTTCYTQVFWAWIFGSDANESDWRQSFQDVFIRKMIACIREGLWYLEGNFAQFSVSFDCFSFIENSRTRTIIGWLIETKRLQHETWHMIWMIKFSDWFFLNGTKEKRTNK